MIDNLSTLLSLSHERISVWFQNRRARYKRSKKDADSIPDNNDLSLTKSGSDDLANFSEENSENNEEPKKDNKKLKDKSSNSNNAKEKPNVKISIVHQDLSKITRKCTPDFIDSHIFNPMLLPHYTPAVYPPQNSHYQAMQSVYPQQNQCLESSSKNNQNILPITKPDSLISSTPTPTPPSNESISESPKSHDEQEEEKEVKSYEFNQNLYQPYLSSSGYTSQANLPSFYPPQNYPNFQNNMFNNVYNQGFLPHYPNLFQPYIDCNLPSLPATNNPYFQSYQGYYNN